MQSVQLQIEIPVVSERAIEKWKEFLRADAVANGGSASTIVRRVFDNRPLKIVAFSDGLVVIEILDGFRLAEELAAFYKEASDT